MNEPMTDEDVARLIRRRDAQRAGIDLARDMCAHDYVNGIGCDDCRRYSRRVVLLIWGILLAASLTIAGWAGWTTGWIEAVLERLAS